MKSSTTQFNPVNKTSGSSEIKMRGIQLALIMALGSLTYGCSNVERSRDLDNASVPASVTAVQVCSNCHGVDGNPVSPNFPRLAGQQPEYFISQMQNFRSHKRADPEGFEYMWGLSRNLTDKQIEGLADYFSKQKVRTTVANDFDPKLIATGKEIYEQGVPDQSVIACSACHGQKGEGTGAFPRLANQHADYLVKQLNVFQNTQQRPGTPMEMISHPLTGEHKDAVAAFLQTFPN